MARSRVVNLANFEQFTAVNILADPGVIGGPKIIPSVAEINVAWLLPGGKTGHNILHGRYTGSFAGTVAQANTILAALNSGAAWTALGSHLAPTVGILSVSLRDLNTANQGIISSTGAGSAGTGTAPAVPNEVALVVTLHTALTGRANRGRMFIPGWSVATIAADNTATAATITDLQTWANTIQAATNSAGYQLVIGQPARTAYIGSTGTSHPARPAGSTIVTSCFVRDNHFDSQRRRGLK